MQKLIKLSDTHYIIVDDSEIKEGDLNIPSDFSKIEDVSVTSKEDLEIVNDRQNGYLKITYSTQPIEEIVWWEKETRKSKLGFDKIKPLSLSEVEELIYGYSVEKMANSHCEEQNRLSNSYDHGSFIEGFKAHQELVKDKLFTAQDVINIVEKSRETGLTAEYFIIKHLLPKTEWKVKFNEQGKLTLI
jgi:hypothetical protein